MRFCYLSLPVHSSGYANALRQMQNARFFEQMRKWPAAASCRTGHTLYAVLQELGARLLPLLGESDQGERFIEGQLAEESIRGVNMLCNLAHHRPGEVGPLEQPLKNFHLHSLVCPTADGPMHFPVIGRNGAWKREQHHPASQRHKPPQQSANSHSLHRLVIDH